MTAKEAISRIIEHNEIHHRKERNAFLTTQALNMAVEALEKQMPKKPIITVHKCHAENSDELLTYSFMHCPCCFDNAELKYFDSLIDSGAKYCRRCGQAMDWHEELNKNI